MNKDERWFEDYVTGEAHDLGTVSLSEDEIVAFATRFDPQPFHMDREAAAASVYGGIIASGWHTAAAMMRLVVDGFISRQASLGSPGLDQIRWLRPVRPGDLLRARVTVLETRRSASKPDRGIVTTEMAMLGEDGEPVMTCRGAGALSGAPGVGKSAWGGVSSAPLSRLRRRCRKSQIALS